MQAASGMENLRSFTRHALPRYDPDDPFTGHSQQCPSSCPGIEMRPRTAARWSTFLRLVSRILPTPQPKEKGAEIAADLMTTFYHVQIGALETQKFRTPPVPYWLVCFSDTIKGPLRQMFFVVPAAGWDGCCGGRGGAGVVNLW